MRLTLALLFLGCAQYDAGYKAGILAERAYVREMRARGLCERPAVEPCDGGAP